MMTNVCKSAPTNSKDKRALVVTLGMVQRTSFEPSRYTGHEEPDLAEMIDDPITRRLMDSDGIGYDHLMDVIRAARVRLQR